MRLEAWHTDSMSDQWASHLAAWRARAGLTQEQLAAAIEPPTTKGTISLYESGKRRPSVGRLAAIATVLKTTSGAILETDPDADDATDNRWLPSAGSIHVLLERGLSVLPAGRVDPVDVEALSHALVAAMKYLARQPAMEHDEGYLAGAVSTLELAMQDRTVPRPPSANSKPDHKARNHANKQT